MKVHLQRSIGLVVVLALTCAVIPYSARAMDPNSYLYLAHAASGRNISSTTNPAYPVDISVGGRCSAQGVSFGEIRGPFTVPAGVYAVHVSVADSANPCSNAAVFSATIVLGAGSTSMGIVTLNSSNQVSGKIFVVDLTAVPVGQGRVIVANTTSENLTGTITAGDSTSAPESRNFSAGSVTAVAVRAGEYSATIYPEGSTTAATGPLEFQVVSRNVHLMVLAGSTANSSVQFIGPQVIRDVF